MFTEENAEAYYESRSPIADLTGPGDRRAGAVQLFFPSDLKQMGHYVTFRAFKFERLNGRTNPLAIPQATITLPIPSSLDTGYKANYDNASGAITSLLGDIGAGAMGGIESLLQSSTSSSMAQGEPQPKETGNNLDKIRSKIGEMLKAERSDVFSSIGNLGKQAAAVGANVLVRGGGEPVKAAVAGAAGVAANPFNVLLYNGPDMRDHSFSYRLIARNKKESESIKQIIKAFKYHMSGKYGTGKLSKLIGDIPENNFTDVPARAFLEYPEYFEISFNYKKYLFEIGPSVLKNFTVSYHPENYPAYVRSLTNPEDDPAPLEVAIRMDFQERDIVTKDSIMNEFR